MKKLFLANCPIVRSPFKTIGFKASAYISVFFLNSCTTTQLRWDAIGVREQIMKYYNDEIMENLVRQENGLAFVHVDVSTVTAIAASQVTGMVGAGETRTFTRGPAGVAGTISRALMRPFSYSVAPQQGDSLTITSTTNLGSKEIYKPYGDFKKFLDSHQRKLAYSELARPMSGYVPGTLKWYDNKFYYIRDDNDEKAAYLDLCKNLFTATRPKLSFQDVQSAVDTSERVQGLQAIPRFP
jgi:hypothetical protein